MKYGKLSLLNTAIKQYIFPTTIRYQKREFNGIENGNCQIIYGNNQRLNWGNIWYNKWEISVINVWITNVFLFLFVFYSTSAEVPQSQPIVNVQLPTVVELPLDSHNPDVEVIIDSDVKIFEPLLPLQYPFYTEISINHASFKTCIALCLLFTLKLPISIDKAKLFKSIRTSLSGTLYQYKIILIFNSPSTGTAATTTTGTPTTPR